MNPTQKQFSLTGGSLKKGISYQYQMPSGPRQMEVSRSGVFMSLRWPGSFSLPADFGGVGEAAGRFGHTTAMRLIAAIAKHVAAGRRDFVFVMG